MHAVIRTFSGSGARELIDLFEQRKEEVGSLIRSVSGFQAYSFIRTRDGYVAVSVCQDKAGTDEILRVAQEWIQENASNLGASLPVDSEGPVLLHLS